MTMLNEHPRQQLQVIIARFGHSVCDDPKRCEAMLRDLCPEHKREVNLLVAALKEKVAHDLLNPPAFIPLEATLKSLSQRLQDNHGTAEPFADWAVESWALSLNIIQKTILKQSAQQTVIKTLSIPQPKIVATPPTPRNIIPSTPLMQQRISKFIMQEGIATDTTTGLIWCRFAYGQTWQNGTVKGDAKLVNWKTAFDVAKQFNNQGGYKGCTDWRLPSIDELNTLIDKTKGKQGNYIDVDVFSNSFCLFWSSSFFSNDNSYAWFVDFSSGYGDIDYKSGSGAVRLVRNR